MADSPFNATVSDLAAVLLTETIVSSAKSDELIGIPIEAIDRINPSIVIGSMTTNDPVRLSQTKPTLILSEEQKNTLKSAFSLIRDNIELNLSNKPIDNRLSSIEISKNKEKQSDVYYEHSRLISLSAINAVKTRTQLESDGSSSGDKQLKTPDDINNQISKLNHTVSLYPIAQSINMATALSEFWQDFKREGLGNDIENKISEMFNSMSDQTSERLRSTANSKLEEHNTKQLSISEYKSTEQPTKSDRYSSIEVDNTQSANSSAEEKPNTAKSNQEYISP
ncbi:MAG: hypothetical protein VYA60_07690 [Pseudomonadota bacterium]|nr:hypothetical protein [Pseudomonadota bacterium]